MKVALLVTFLVSLTAAGNFNPDQSILCDVCEFLGDEVQGRILTDDAKRKVIFAAKAVCAHLPIFSKECDLAVNEHGKDWVDMLFKLWDVDVLCSKAHLCKDKVEYSHLGEGEACTACMDGLDLVKTIIASDDMKGLLHVIVNETCMALSSNAASCEMLTDTIIDQILGNLVPMFNVKSLCESAGACPASLTLEKPTELGCTVCKDVFGIVSTTVNSDELDELIQISVNQTCQLIGFGVEQCEHVFLYLAGSAMDNLKRMVEPNFVCGKLGSCPATAVPVLYSAVKDSEGCKACMDGMDLIQQILKSDELLDLVNIGIDEACKLMGGDVATCEGVIGGILNPVIKNLIQLFDPASLCQEMNACPALQISRWEGGIFCQTCEDAVQELKNIAEDHETDDMLNELTNILCNAIQIPFCKSVIGAIVKESLQDVENLDANTTCANIGACTSAVRELETVGDTCSECTMIAGEVITLLENEQVDALIKEAITEVCTILPISNCEATIDGYFDQIVALVKNLPPKTLCSLIGLC